MNNGITVVCIYEKKVDRPTVEAKHYLRILPYMEYIPRSVW